MNGFEPGNECAVCKGRCCREKGCSLCPEDMIKALSQEAGLSLRHSIALTEEKLLSFLKEEGNLYAIDFFNRPEGPLYYLRMRHKCYTFIGVDAMGECIALTKEGCSLPMENRPKGGRFLESKPDGHCVQHYSKEQMASDWAPYQKTLKAIWDEYYNLFMSDGTFDRCDEANFAWMKAVRETK